MRWPALILSFSQRYPTAVITGRVVYPPVPLRLRPGGFFWAQDDVQVQT